MSDNVRNGSKAAAPPRAATGLDTTARRAPYPPMRDHDADVIIAEPAWPEPPWRSPWPRRG